MPRRNRSYEWAGFLNTSALTLTTATQVQELMPDAMTGATGTPDLLIVRIVGTITLFPESSATASTMVGMNIVRSVSDEAGNVESSDPLSTDVDARAVDQLWGWAGRPEYGGPLDATALDLSVVITVDIKIKRRLDKRHGINLQLRAAVTNLVNVQTALRVLSRHAP